jgi:antitoxin MazE
VFWVEQRLQRLMKRLPFNTGFSRRGTLTDFFRSPPDLFLNRSGHGYTIRMYIHGGFMRVAKWGNSLAVRLPAAVVEALDLKDGDDIEIRVAGGKKFEVKKDPSREQALEGLRKLSRKLSGKFPERFIFDREDAHER